LSVLDAENGSSNSKTFTVTESVPVVTASVTQGQVFQQINLNGLVTDQAVEGHRVRIHWGDGHEDVLDLGVGTGGSFSTTHTFAQTQHLHHDTILLTPLDDQS